ncbi:putative sucrose utilization protein SUC1, partial [Tolypocladium ophioglossoides CBS 100239]
DAARLPFPSPGDSDDAPGDDARAGPFAAALAFALPDDDMASALPLTPAAEEWLRGCSQSQSQSQSSNDAAADSDGGHGQHAGSGPCFGDLPAPPGVGPPCLSNSPWPCDETDAFQLPPAFFEPYVQLFFDRLYPVFPVLDHQCVAALLRADEALAPISGGAYALLASLSAAVVVQLNIGDPQMAAAGFGDSAAGASPGPGQPPFSAQFFVSQCLQARQRYAFIEDADEWTVLTSFFLFAYYGNLDQSRSAWYYLREAISFAQALGIDETSSYAGLDPETQQRRCRLFWLLFITERAYALQHRRQVILRPSMELPKVFESQDPKLIYGFVTLTKIFKTIDNEFISAWRQPPPAGDACGPGDPCESMTKLLGQEDVTGSLSVSEIDETQRLDVLVTQQWLRVLVCQMHVRQFLPHPVDVDDIDCAGSQYNNRRIHEQYVLDTSKTLLQIVSKANRLSLEAHGIGMEQKIADAANCLCDFVTGLGARDLNDSGFFCVPDLLHNFMLFLSRFRGRESQYLQPLVHKATTVFAARIQPPFPLLIAEGVDEAPLEIGH